MNRYTISERVALEIDDEDSHTPAMVYAGRKDKYSSTYDCAVGTGCVGSEDEVTLRLDELKELMRYDKLVDEAFSKARGPNW